MVSPSQRSVTCIWGGALFNFSTVPHYFFALAGHCVSFDGLECTDYYQEHTGLGQFDEVTLWNRALSAEGNYHFVQNGALYKMKAFIEMTTL
jgi:hypothetical protein